jgi:DNA-binding GntR family transcriptional regulator
MNGTVFQKIPKHDSLVSHVLEQIINAIVNGQLRAEDKLVEERLAEQLGVSRGPVREAIRQLESLGLVTKRPYKGAFVSDLDENEVVEMQAVRLVLEGMAVRLLIENATPEKLAAIEEIISSMREVATRGDRRQILVHDADFHDALVKLSGNGVLADTWEPLSIKMRRFLFLKRRHTHRDIQDVVSAHEKILDAIRSGDPDKAEEALHDHLRSVKVTFSQPTEDGATQPAA